MTEDLRPAELSRRHALTGAAAGLALPLLAACGDEAGSSSATSTPEPTEEPTSSGSGSPGSSGSGGDDAGLVGTAEVEVGGGVIIADQGVVVTQPAAGEFKAFSAACTHQGCQVSDVSDGRIVCSCHGSTFSIEDGAPQGGPASVPLPAVEIEVRGKRIVLA